MSSKLLQRFNRNLSCANVLGVFGHHAAYAVALLFAHHKVVSIIQLLLRYKYLSLLDITEVIF